METARERMQLVEAALGKVPFDLVIRNVQLVNVFLGEVRLGNIGVKNGRIVSINVDPHAETEEVIEGNDMYAMPGFIDTHVHVDSTLLTPASLAEVIVPHGTTAVFADPMEIANVAGVEGIKALMQGSESLPYHLFIQASSRVPTAPGLETTGAEVGLDEVVELLTYQACISLGELDPSKVLGLRPEYFEKIMAAHERRKIANGHAAGLSGRQLTAYASAGLLDDHEIIAYEDARERIELGMAVMVREGSTERNLEALIRGVVEERADTRHWMMCTDDKHPDEIWREGHIDFMINKAVELGLPPMQALQMATINAALHFRLEEQIGTLSPGRFADIVLADELTHVEPKVVLFKGRVVARDGALLAPVTAAPFPDWLYKTVAFTKGDQPQHFRVASSGSEVTARVIEILPDQIVNKEITACLPVLDGNVCADVDQDVLKLAVVERYGKNGNIGLSFVKGFGLKRGALASTVAHDHHNLILVGADEASMATCVRAIAEMQGGLVVVDGAEILGKLPLPIGGLLSEKPASEVIESLDRLNEAAGALGCVLPAPFMTLSFISLPTVPELGLTDKGIVDVRRHELVPGLLA